MKPSFPDFQRGSRCRRVPGFALVISLTLMVLLTVLGVGLLTLSAVSLRESGHGQAMAAARANARLGLMLAIGELQKSLGPDRAIAAPSELLAGEEGGRPRLTGVWDSWDFDPAQGAPDYAAEKDRRFKTWLVSSADPAKTRELDFVKSPAEDDDESVPLVASTRKDGEPSDEVRAGSVPVEQGAFAWQVADESVKARIDMTRDPSRDDTLADRRSLVAGHRSGIRSLKSADGTAFDFLPGDDSGEEFAKSAAVSPPRCLRRWSISARRTCSPETRTRSPESFAMI